MGKKVLVVDDDPDVRLFNVTVLEENGYTPLVATNGEEGRTWPNRKNRIWSFSMSSCPGKAAFGCTANSKRTRI